MIVPWVLFVKILEWCIMVYLDVYIYIFNIHIFVCFGGIDESIQNWLEKYEGSPPSNRHSGLADHSNRDTGLVIRRSAEKILGVGCKGVF